MSTGNEEASADDRSVLRVESTREQLEPLLSDQARAAFATPRYEWAPDMLCVQRRFVDPITADDFRKLAIDLSGLVEHLARTPNPVTGALAPPMSIPLAGGGRAVFLFTAFAGSEDPVVRARLKTEARERFGLHLFEQGELAPP